MMYWYYYCLCFLLLSSAASSFRQLQQLPNSATGFYDQKGLSFEEEKTRLGSTPPSCHNKCNRCHPCMAVQVPTVPAGLTKAITNSLHFSHPSSGNDHYSNYKPLAWKCRCGDHFYNP